jgi:aspartate/methionine/tyrosine aminotransferase
MTRDSFTPNWGGSEVIMEIPRFELERYQSAWEEKIARNIAESGVDPLSLRELVGDPATLERLLQTSLAYPPTRGTEELRSRIAALYPGARPENVLVTAGCAEANFLATWSLIEPGDEVVFLQPNYMQIAGLARGLGAEVKPLWLRESLGWQPSLDELDELITPRTKLVAICNPDNPTGAILPEGAMDRIAAAATRAGAYLLADEVYRGAELEGPMGLTFWGRVERLFCTGGLSKPYGLPGLRIGWVLAESGLVEKLWSCHDYTSISPTMLSDRLAAIALEPSRHARLRERTQRILQRNYPLVRDWVARRAPALTHIPPKAGAIAWIGYRNGRRSLELAEEVRRRKGVLVVPGEQFEMEGYLRVGYGGPADILAQALAAIDEVMFGASTHAL